MLITFVDDSPINSRCSIKPMRWKNTTPGQPDHYIPPRSRCLYSVLIMHRRKDLWGPDGASAVVHVQECEANPRWGA